MLWGDSRARRSHPAFQDVTGKANDHLEKVYAQSGPGSTELVWTTNGRLPRELALQGAPLGVASASPVPGVLLEALHVPLPTEAMDGVEKPSGWGGLGSGRGREAGEGGAEPRQVPQPSAGGGKGRGMDAESQVTSGTRKLGDQGSMWQPRGVRRGSGAGPGRREGTVSTEEPCLNCLGLAALAVLNKHFCRPPERRA